MPTNEEVETAYAVYKARNRELYALPATGSDEWNAAYDAARDAFAAYIRIADEYLRKGISLPKETQR